MSHGTATFTRAYIGHEPMPPQVAKKMQAPAVRLRLTIPHRPPQSAPATTRSSSLSDSLMLRLGTRGAHARAAATGGLDTLDHRAGAGEGLRPGGGYQVAGGGEQARAWTSRRR